jgi:gamma-glutamylcyclotransferase
MQPKIYFAFGSNLHLQQMANRCPESRLLGIGRLHGYRWQINERGYANVITHDASFVDGICYLLNQADEASLDINEGVRIEAYEKRMLDIEVICRPAALVGRDVVQIVHDGSLDCRRSSTIGQNDSRLKTMIEFSTSAQHPVCIVLFIGRSH